MRTFLSAVALSVLLSTAASAATFDSPGTYDVTLVAFSALLPPDALPPGTPVVGPTVYEGELRIQRTPQGFKARFQGESWDGYKINVKAEFDSGWGGVTTDLLPVSGSFVEAIVAIDHDHLLNGQVNGTVLADGFERRVQASVGNGGSLLDLRVH